MIDRRLLEEATSRDGLLRLLADEERGLGWEINPEFALYDEPEISRGVKGGVHVNVQSLVRASDEDRWLILLAEFEQEYVRRDLRELLSSLRRTIRATGRFPETSGHGDTIFIVAAPGYEDKVESDEISFRQSEMQDTLDRLFEVRAVDPACGSGAYLLMLLQRLFELVDRLEVVRDKKRDPDQKHLYNTKLRLLQRCVYGVDLSEIAVRIARLRLWLSLVVENRGEKPEPLPNFDFLVMCGDSLASPVKPDQHTLGYPHDAIREYTRLKRRYFHPEPGSPRPTREEMSAKRAEIAEAFQDEFASSRLRSLSKNPFDWEIDFAEVFDQEESPHTLGGRLNLGPLAGRGGQGELPAGSARPPGFDIVIANPPYVREQLISVDKSALRGRFPEVFHGKADLYTYFFGLAAALLADGGQLAFITPNRWLKTDYAAGLRRELLHCFGLCYLINFDDLPVFQGQVTYSLITIAKKGRPGANKYLRVQAFSQSDTDLAYMARNESIEIMLPSGGEPWRQSAEELCQGTQSLGHR